MATLTLTPTKFGTMFGSRRIDTGYAAVSDEKVLFSFDIAGLLNGSVETIRYSESRVDVIPLVLESLEGPRRDKARPLLYRDRGRYGICDADRVIKVEDANITICLAQLALDIVCTTADIATIHRGHERAYALWYMQRSPPRPQGSHEEYSRLVTRSACALIKAQDALRGTPSGFRVVEF